MSTIRCSTRARTTTKKGEAYEAARQEQMSCADRRRAAYEAAQDRKIADLKRQLAEIKAREEARRRDEEATKALRGSLSAVLAADRRFRRERERANEARREAKLARREAERARRAMEEQDRRDDAEIQRLLDLFAGKGWWEMESHMKRLFMR